MSEPKITAYQFDRPVPLRRGDDLTITYRAVIDNRTGDMTFLPDCEAVVLNAEGVLVVPGQEVLPDPAPKEKA